MPPQEQQRAQRGCPLPWVLGAPRAPQSNSSDVVLLQPPPRFGRAPATCRAYLGPRPSAAPPRPPAARFATLASGRRGPRGAVSPRQLQLAAPSAPQPAPPAPAAGTAPTPRRAPCRRLHFPSHAPSLFTAAHAHARARTDVSHAHRPSAVSSEPNGRALRALAGSARVLAQQRPLGNVVPAGQQRSRRWSRLTGFPSGPSGQHLL